LIAKEGFDPQFGVRPIKRAIQDRLPNSLATEFLLGEFNPSDRIKVAAPDGEPEFAKKWRPATPPASQHLPCLQL